MCTAMHKLCINHNVAIYSASYLCNNTYIIMMYILHVAIQPALLLIVNCVGKIGTKVSDKGQLNYVSCVAVDKEGHILVIIT